jgi:hypothetical protein
MPREEVEAEEPNLRVPRLARLALLALLMGVLAFVDEPDRTVFWGALFDAGHVLLFGLAALLVRGVLAPDPVGTGKRWTSAWALLITLAVGAASEVLQLLQPGRDASVGDLLRDAAGAAAFLLLRAAVVAPGAGVSGQTAVRRRGAAGLLAVSLLVAAAVPFVRVVDAYVERDRAFPTLFGLDGSRWERQFVWTGDAELVPDAMPRGRPAAEGAPLARLSLRPGRYPGLVLDEPYPDWRGYQRLVFWTYSETDAPLTLTIRVHDAGHDGRWNDRFNTRVVVTRGAHRIAIPLDEIRRAPRGREMDMSRIRGIVMYAYRLDRPARVYLGPLRLE